MFLSGGRVRHWLKKLIYVQYIYFIFCVQFGPEIPKEVYFLLAHPVYTRYLSDISEPNTRHTSGIS